MNRNLRLISGLLFGLLNMTGCEEQVYCDLSFRAFGFQWTDSTHFPSKIHSVVQETGDTLINTSDPFENYFYVVTDEHHPILLHHTYHVNVWILDQNYSLLAQCQYVTTADNCHVQKISGPEILP